MILNLVKDISTLWNTKDVKTTSLIFKLVTKYSVSMFLVFTILICSVNFFGKPIECFSEEVKWRKAMELKCWMQGVFIDEELFKHEIGTQIVHTGVGSRGTNARYSNTERKLITYKFYQWIVPLLLFQTFCLYIPRIIWHLQEKGTMTKLLREIYSPVFTDDWLERRKRLIAYVKDVAKKYHRQYVYKYFLCEILTIVVILINMFSMQLVINDFWKVYQPAVAAFFSGNFEKFSQEAARLFPIQAKCDFYNVGPSGGIQRKDALCILPQNVINEKIFVLIYIWYIFILICAILNVLYFIAMAFSKILRIYNIGHMLERAITIKDSRIISGNGDIGLWFTLSIYRKNMVAIYFQDFCKELYAELKRDSNRSFEKNQNFDYDEDDEKYL